MSSVDENIPNGWKETTLGQLIHIKHGFAFKGTYISEVPNQNILVTPGNFSLGGGFKRDKFKYYYSDIPQDYILKTDDVIVTMTDLSKEGDTLGYSALVPGGNSIYLHNQRIGLVIFKNDNFDKQFAHWLLRTRHYQKSMVNSSTGSTVSHTSPTRIQEYEFNLPPLLEQKAIAKILTAFDDKIENLQAQNKTLEQTAQTIFKEWFGKYQIEDELPDGWRVDTIDNLVDLIIDYRGKTPKKLGMDWSETGIPALSAKTIKKGKIVRRDAMNFGSEELYSVWMKDELKKGDILLTSEAPLGELYYLNDDTKYILSQRLFALRANENITSEYLYFYLFSKNGQHLLEARASGSTVQGIRQSELRKIEVIIPEEKILEKASNIFKSTQEKKFRNSKQIHILKKTRNALLPKLMSGQLRVNEFKG